MTADLDLSPEAVERLAKVCCETGSNYMTASQAPAVMLALSAENARLRAANGDEGGFCGDTIGKQAIGHLREMYRSAFDALGPSGRVSLRNFIDNRLRAERDAAWQAGAEAMREEIAQWTVVYGFRDPLEIAYDIRALPLPDQPKEDAPPFQASTLDALLSVATDDEADAIRACAARVSNR